MWENSRDIQHAPIFVRGRLSARERRDEYRQRKTRLLIKGN